MTHFQDKIISLDQSATTIRKRNTQNNQTSKKEIMELPTFKTRLSVLTDSMRPTLNIRKTCPCNVYPLEPHVYIVKLGYAGVYLFFLFLLQNIDCGYSLEPPRRGGSNVYPQSMFRAKIRKISNFFS